jgi:pimeloyl-ACP methyl ester carboxylesterase
MKENSITKKSRKISGLSLTILLICLAGMVALFQQCRQGRPDKAAPAKLMQPPVVVKENIHYKTGDNLEPYEKERCLLDLYLPEKVNGFPIMVWFHGGSLKRLGKDDAATKALAKRFAGEGVGVAVVNYRLSPLAKYPAYIKDAAAAVAWVRENIGRQGGNPEAVFIAGHSAGGYLSLMLALVPEYLQECRVNHMSIAGIISIGGQTFTHYAIREERGMPNPEITPVIDEAAPCFHARRDAPPILAVWADGDSPDRIEENKYLLAIQKMAGHRQMFSREIKNRNHWSLITKITDPGDPLAEEIVSFIKQRNRILGVGSPEQIKNVK